MKRCHLALFKSILLMAQRSSLLSSFQMACTQRGSNAHCRTIHPINTFWSISGRFYPLSQRTNTLLPFLLKSQYSLKDVCLTCINAIKNVYHFLLCEGYVNSWYAQLTFGLWWALIQGLITQQPRWKKTKDLLPGYRSPQIKVLMITRSNH